MAKKLKDIIAKEVYEPKSPDERRFKDKHITVKHKDRNGNDDKLFNATNIKPVDRKKEGHGYNPGEDEKVYEEKMTAADKAKEKSIKKKVDPSGMKASMKKQYGEKKGEQVYFATIRKKAMESVESKGEQIDEVLDSEKTFGNYFTKAVKQIHDFDPYRDSDKAADAVRKRTRGLSIIAKKAEKQIAAKKNVKEEVEQIDEAVAADMYHAHHARAMKSLENMAKHLDKHKKLCCAKGKSPMSWHASEMKALSRNLEDMEHNMAQNNEYAQPINTDKVAG